MTQARPTSPALNKLRGIALVLMLLGLVVIVGWLLRQVELVRLFPTLRSMVFNTALCFLLMGFALRQWSPAAPLGVASALLALGLAALNLLQLLGGVSLGIDLTAFHAWADDGNPNPGRMSLPTTLCFLLAAGSLLLARLGGRTDARRALLGRVMAAVVFAFLALSSCVVQLAVVMARMT